MSINQKKISHTQLICDISELSGLFTGTTSLESCLQKIVEMIAEHMGSEVCSIYLFSEETQELVLQATRGLNSEYIGKVRMKIGEGLTGLALKEIRPICERHASTNRNFKYFPGLGEEKYESFLVVPIVRGLKKIGALVIQNMVKNYFGEEDIVALRAISVQLAHTIEMTQLILSLEDKSEKPVIVPLDKKLKFIKGRVGSRGFAYEGVIVLAERKNLRQMLDSRPAHEYSLQDLEDAIEKSTRELDDLQSMIQKDLSDVASFIFTAQMLMLKDRAFVDAIIGRVKDGMNPPEAIVLVVEDYAQRFEKISDDYLKEKSHDVRDIGRRLLNNLFAHDKGHQGLEGAIVIATDLVPSDILKLSTERVRGIILLSGGVTGHVAILAQSLHLPLIISDQQDLLHIQPGTKILIDGEQGNIYIDPSPQILEPFKNKMASERIAAKLKEQMTSETLTKDGTPVTLMANINLLSDLRDAQEFKAQGIGLYRTEFPFIVRNEFPSEEEQFVIYKKIVNSMNGKEVTFRTLDIGGDKILSYFDHHHKEKNPYMGMRSIRFSLKHIDIFSAQIRAILRAGVGAKLRIMFPMISSIDELIEVKAILDVNLKLLKHGKVDHNEKPMVGAMIELPSVMEIIEDLAQQVDFFSIGTNDFIQYMLAVDRSNEKVADLYLPHHPSVLRALKKVVDAALKFKIDVSVCGDMAYDERFMNFFLGVGVRKFSLTPTLLPKTQCLMKKVDVLRARDIATGMLKKSLLKEIAPMLELT